MSNHLFEVNETARKLRERYTEAFHIIVAKLFFLFKQARPDILIGVALLTMRMREPNKYEDKKLGRILKYIRGTRYLVLNLESGGTGTVKWWVDAAFAVHHDMKRHTVGMM